MSKPDNQADYEAHLQEHIDHTIANLHEAEAYLDEHASMITAGKKQLLKLKMIDAKKVYETLGSYCDK